MGWSEYSTKATTNSEVLKERIKKAFFHFKGPHTWEDFNFQTGKAEKQTEMVEYDFIDVAVLLGIRETCYQQEGDVPLDKEEIHRFLESLNKQHVIHTYIYPVEEKRTETWEELIRSFNEWNDRLVTGKVTENADGSVEVYLNAQTYMSLWMALTTVYPGSEIDVWEYEDYDNGEDWYTDYNRFIVKYGTRKQIDHTDDGGSWGCDDEETEDNTDVSSSNNADIADDVEMEDLTSIFADEDDDTPSEQHNEETPTYNLGMDYAYKGEYEKSIEILSTLEGNTDALNNIGVDYERLGQYEKAYEYYLKANTPWSLDNLLGLYNTGKIPMNIEDYTSVCNHLVELGDYHGYIYLSKLYIGKHESVPANGQLALEYAKKGYETFPKVTYVVFNLAWCLHEYATTEEDKQESHRLYESILFNSDTRDGTVYLTTRYNYAWQCQEGYGCEQDISRAIYWYKRAFEEGYVNAARQLAYVYSTFEGYKNQEFVDFWSQQYKENGGEED